MLAAGLVLPALPGHPGLSCPLRALTGIPCPLCGMTTSVEATLHLDIAGALRANPAGVVAVVIAIALVVLRPTRVRIAPAVPLATLCAMWTFELHRFGVI
jgi:hypothetical protein